MDYKRPLFMWAGGKTKLLSSYKPYFPKSFSSYIEPFVGGGAIFLHIYKQYPHKKYWINDINEQLINIYISIRDYEELFLGYLNKLESIYLSQKDKPARKKFYYELRYKHAYQFQEWDKTKESAALYFLMKTSFNGIWQINKNTNNRFGTPAGLLNHKDKVFNYETIHYWHQILQNVYITTQDFTSCIPTEPNTLIYLDPPYRNSFTQYNIDFNDSEQKRIIEYMNKHNTNNHILMSNRDLEDNFWESLNDKFKTVYFDVTYTAGRRKKTKEGFQAKKATELLFYNSIKEIDILTNNINV